MTTFLIRRFIAMVATLFAVSVTIFLMVRLMTGDIISIIFFGDEAATDEQKNLVRKQLGIDGSYYHQYTHWAGRILFHGDFGNSFQSGQPIAPILGHAIHITAELIVLGILIALLFAIPLGVISAVKRDSAADYGARLTGLIGISIPGFWLATLLIIFTSRVFNWLPPLLYVSITSDPWKNFTQFIFPALSISVFTLAIVMRMLRATMLEVLNLDYVRTARAKGVPRRTVLIKHALRNALIPVVTVAGFEVGYLIAGAAIVETIFNLPGVGYNLLHAISQRDYPLIEATTLLIAAVFVVVNTLVDLVYGMLDPRISVAD